MKLAEKVLGIMDVSEMANLAADKYKIPLAIWTSEMQSYAKKNYARVKVAREYGQTVGSGNSFELLFDADTADFTMIRDGKKTYDQATKVGKVKKDDIVKIVEFVKKYKRLFMQFWSMKITEDQFKDTLRQAVKYNNPDIEIINN